MTEGRVILRYLELFLLPLPSQMTFDYAFPISVSPLRPPSTLLAAVLHAALIALALLARRRRPLLTFGILGFYLLQLPEGTFMPLDLIFEHRTYLPAFFLALALMDLLQWVVGRRGALAAAVALATLWGGFGHQRNQVWASSVALWEDTVAKAPGSARAQSSLGEAYLDLGNREKAVEHLQEAIRLKPNFSDALILLGIVYGKFGPLEESVMCLRRAIASERGNAKAHFNLAITLVRLARYAEANTVWRALQAIDPALAERLRRLMPGRFGQAAGVPERKMGAARLNRGLRPIRDGSQVSGVRSSSRENPS